MASWLSSNVLSIISGLLPIVEIEAPVPRRSDDFVRGSIGGDLTSLLPDVALPSQEKGLVILRVCGACGTGIFDVEGGFGGAPQGTVGRDAEKP